MFSPVDIFFSLICRHHMPRRLFHFLSPLFRRPYAAFHFRHCFHLSATILLYIVFDYHFADTDYQLPLFRADYSLSFYFLA